MPPVAEFGSVRTTDMAARSALAIAWRHKRTRIVEPRRAMSLHGAPGTRIAVSAGRIWLTEPGVRADHFVCAGQSYVVVRRGPVVIESDCSEPAVVHLFGAGLLAHAYGVVIHWLGRTTR